jgi:ATP-dependent Lhr-like helicase
VASTRWWPPQGSGKTLTAFLAAIDDLVRRGLEPVGLPDETVVVSSPSNAWHWPRSMEPLGWRAQRQADFLSAHGTSFFDEMLQGTRLLPVELEEALAELVVRGRANCDSFGGLRALMVPTSKRAPGRHGRIRRPLFGVEDAGRWSLVRAQPSNEAADEEDVEHVVRTLLRRYGVITWRLLEREAAWLPRWRDLVPVCRRLEARGELRGGRFIAGVSGEQFALPEAFARMRELRR